MMNAIRRDLRVVAIYGTVSMLLILSACITLTPTPSEAELLLAAPCEACAQATLAVVLTQERNYADNQAAATAEIVRANAQATLNSAHAMLSAAQTQDQNNANVMAAQVAATAEIVRANAQATLNSANSTQSAALTQDAIHQTQMADLATTGAQAIMNQQNKDQLAANTIAMQQAQAAATSQWYTDQERQRNVQRQGSITFLWVWCFPIFVVLLAGLVLWGFWRWLRIQQANQRILEIPPVDKLPAPAAEVIYYPREDSLPYLESDMVGSSRYLLTKPDDQVRWWLDEVKRNLRSSDNNTKDEDD